MHVSLSPTPLFLSSARIHQPATLRALYGLTDTRNSFHGSGMFSLQC